MRVQRHHLIIAGVVLLGITFLAIGVLKQKRPTKFYGHSLRTWQEADSVAGYPVTVGTGESQNHDFARFRFQPNLSTLSALELYLLPTAQSFTEPETDPITAAGTGLVLFAGDLAQSQRKAVLLGHRLPTGEVIQTFYAGLNTVQVKVGEHVSQGQTIGAGELLFEIRRGIGIDLVTETIAGFVLNTPASPTPGNRIDPENFFEKYKQPEPHVSPLAIIQAEQHRSTRQKIGLE